MESNTQDDRDLLHVTLQAISDAVVTTDEIGRLQMLNPSAAAILGWSSAESVGKPIEQIIQLREKHGERRPFNPGHACLQLGIKLQNSENYIMICRDGRRIAIEISVSPLRDSSGSTKGCVLIFRDVSYARQLSDRMSYLAHHDALTGLPNRILLVDRFEQGIRQADRSGDRLATMFLDLDHFTEIKNSIGSKLADELLKEVAFRLKAALRESDTVSRLGGDEFVVMLPGMRVADSVEAIAAKLVREMAEPFVLPETTIQASCSIGISVYPHDGSEVGTLMRLADEAMNRAKRDGRNQYCFARPSPNASATAETQSPDPAPLR